MELALGVFALMVPVAIAVMSFGPWLQRVTFARHAAAEVSRAVVVADGESAAALSQISTMAANHGYSASEVRVGLCGAAPIPVAAGGSTSCPPALLRGTGIRARVEIDVPLLVLPWRDGAGNPVTVGGVAAAAEHESLVDLYRSVGG